MMEYSVYIVECADGTYYTGIATDIQRRLLEHNGANGKGARYTSARSPVSLVYEVRCESRSAALKEEHRIKRLAGPEAGSDCRIARRGCEGAVTATDENFDAVILGAGAAGLMCALTAGQRGRKVLLLERTDKAGAKILISGGGRCNFTNLDVAPTGS